jgi:hypothetical protein
VPGLRTIGRAAGGVTPGLGLRARSPLGLLRLDVGVGPAAGVRLPVVVADETGADGGRIVRLTAERRYAPGDVASGGWGRFRRRLVVHFSMGEAF